MQRMNGARKELGRVLFGLGLAFCFSGITGLRATPVAADIMWLVDTSGSMYSQNKLPALKERLAGFDAAMVANGIDARYALVTFRGTEQLQQDFVSFDVFGAATSPFMTLGHVEGGGAHPEYGSDAILLGLRQATFRPGAVANLILFTDEDDQSSLGRFQEADRLLGERNALFNVVADADFKHSSSGVGNVVERYGWLADQHGGELFDLKRFLDSTMADSFFKEFADTKVREIRMAVPEGGATGALLLAALGLLGFFKWQETVGHGSRGGAGR